ncbi:hypothetical protein [Roseobacter sinensis]|uniref:G domain-containing protein n=1 Tax=Roseobacter sinensis TaxID=2931391 RepID=A0ABT3BHR3_9RHOB|nr:hypothetical protein [Roseobacter sp. WL0113]MCV3273121.1 hypothetical protein [Roseobacter sp. WL0113]
MLDDLSPETVVARLDHALDHGGLTGSSRTQARALRDRLRAGVQVMILGPKGVGKSQLCEVMLELDASAPEDEACWARRYMSAAACAAGDEEGLQTMALPSPLLDTTSLIDVATPTAPEALAERVDWALRHADIVIWCTDTFAADEAALWADAPDHLKDHSVLVLTKADVRAAEGTMDARISQLQAVAAEEFHSFFPTAAAQPHRTLCEGRGLDDATLAASGIKALRDTLLRIAASGLRADLDRALLFLDRHDLQPAAEAAPSPAGAITPDAPAAKTYHAALDLLRARIPELSPQDAAYDAPDHVLTACGKLVEDLAELAAEQTRSDDAFEHWRNDLYEASDKVVLMSLENDMRSAADAATVILQLKRDLEGRVAG